MKTSDYEKELNKIRIELYNETKDMTFDEKKERTKKMKERLAKQYNFKYESRVWHCEFLEINWLFKSNKVE